MTQTTTLALPESIESQLLRAISLKDESAGVLLCGRTETPTGLTFSANRLLWVDESHYLHRSPTEMEISSAGWVPHLSEAANLGLQPAFLHTHPQAPPDPSAKDKIVDIRLADTFRVRGRTDDYVSLIAGVDGDELALAGSIIPIDDEARVIDRIRTVGQRIKIRHNAVLDGSTRPSEAFDRQIRAFGQDGQSMLGRIRAGVVGAGGTGSAVIEQLARLGIGSIVIVDDDQVEASNLTRIHESGRGSIGKSKVGVAARAVRSLGFGTAVETVEERISGEASITPLLSCDVVFGCTDSEYSRVVLSRLAYWHLIPVFDVGIRLRSSSGYMRGIDGRMTYMAPGEPCMICRNRIDLRRAHEETLEPEERSRLAEEGYAQGLDDPDPAVVPYTTLVASVAVASFLERLIGFGDPDLSSELLLGIHDWRVSQIEAMPTEGHFCGDTSTWGLGEQRPRLGHVWG